MKNKVLWLVSALSAVISVVSLKYLPDSVPMHFDLNGAADRYGSKAEMFIFPVMIVLLTIIYSVVSKKQIKNTDKNSDEKTTVINRNNVKIIGTSMVVVAFVFLFLQLAMLYTAFKATANNSADTMPAESYSFILAIIGVAFILLGNIMPKAKKNSSIGIRTPWSMANEKTWSMSNRFGGFVLLISGVIMTVCALIFDGLVIMYIYGAVILIAVILSLIYSYSVYKKYGKK